MEGGGEGWMGRRGMDGGGEGWKEEERDGRERRKGMEGGGEGWKGEERDGRGRRGNRWSKEMESRGREVIRARDKGMLPHPPY